MWWSCTFFLKGIEYEMAKMCRGEGFELLEEGASREAEKEGPIEVHGQKVSFTPLTTNC